MNKKFSLKIHLAYGASLGVVVLFLVTKTVWYHCPWYSSGDNYKFSSGNYVLNLKESKFKVSKNNQGYILENTRVFSIVSGDTTKYLPLYDVSQLHDDGKDHVLPETVRYEVTLGGSALPFHSEVTDSGSWASLVSITGLDSVDAHQDLRVVSRGQLTPAESGLIRFNVNDISDNTEPNHVVSQDSTKVKIELDPSVSVKAVGCFERYSNKSDDAPGGCSITQLTDGRYYSTNIPAIRNTYLGAALYGIRIETASL